jgi:hypothetical protein
MPRQKGTGKGSTERFNIRLDAETAAFYRTKANEHGITISEFLRQTLVQGIIAESVQEIENRLKSTVEALNSKAHDSSKSPLSDKILLSILNSEALLSAIVQAKDIQHLYTAQDSAKQKLREIKAEMET